MALIRLARLMTPDADDDVVSEESFGGERGVSVALLPSHSMGSVWLGRARVFARDGYGRARLDFNNSTLAKDWREVLEHDFRDPAGPRLQFSYGFILKNKNDKITINGVQHRWLRDIEILEVSMVLRGASVDSGVDSLGEGEKRMSHPDFVTKDALPYLHKAELLPRPPAPPRQDIQDPALRRAALRAAKADEDRILRQLREQLALEDLFRRVQARGLRV